MTLLSTAQAIVKETKQSVVPSTIIGNNQDIAKQVLEAITVSITTLSRSYDWQELQKENSFSSVASTEGYALPSDFDRFIDNTFWNTTQKRAMIGSVSPQEWRTLNDSTVSGGSVGEYYRIRDNEVKIFPTPTAVESYKYEYITDLIVEDSGGTGQTGWQADTDVPVVDEFILRLDATWRLLKMQGRPYAEEQREADVAIMERTSRNGGKQTIYHNPRRFIIDKSRIGYPATISS